MAKYDFNTTIIGGGVIGLSIAYSLSKRIGNILLLEENDRLGQEISARNSEVVHAGQPGVNAGRAPPKIAPVPFFFMFIALCVLIL